MHTYAGMYPLTFGALAGNGQLPTTPTASTGDWATATIGDDGDPRSAANLFMGLEAALDRTNYLAWRSIDIVEGGLWTWTATISMANQMIWTGAQAYKAQAASAIPGALPHGITAPSMSGTVTLDCSLTNTFYLVGDTGVGLTITFSPINMFEGTTYRVFYQAHGSGSPSTFIWDGGAGGYVIRGNASAITLVNDGKVYWVDFQIGGVDASNGVTLVSYGKST